MVDSTGNALTSTNRVHITFADNVYTSLEKKC